MRLVRPAEQSPHRAEEDAQDEVLAAEVQAGNRGAYAQLVARHLPRTVAVAQRVVLRRAEAEDVAQDVFLKLWRDPFAYSAARAKFATWLYRVTVNRALDVARRVKPVSLPDGFDVVDPALGVVELHAKRERSAALALALGALPARQRAALALAYQTSLPEAEAALAMGVSVKAYESLLVRARRNLRVSLMRGDLHDAG